MHPPSTKKPQIKERWNEPSTPLFEDLFQLGDLFNCRFERATATSLLIAAGTNLQNPVPVWTFPSLYLAFQRMTSEQK